MRHGEPPAVAGRATLLAALGAALAGCATNDPYRSASEDALAPAAQAPCQGYYAQFDQQIWSMLTDKTADDSVRQTFLTQQQRQIEQPQYQPCWRSAYEPHPSDNATLHPAFDLFYAEFDDQGMPTDLVSHPIPFEQSEIALIEQQLPKLLRQETARDGGINLVVFTHGWHGSAAADNAYSTEFKAILQKISAVESQSARQTHRFVRLDAAGHGTPLSVLPRRTVGIEIAWRGDSLLHPALPGLPESQNALNVWDRKNAADTVSKGSIHELLAFLHEFYLANSCRAAPDRTPAPGPGGALESQCDQVHMLTLGHSFGALIDFGTLIGRVESGLNSGCDARAYAYGDLTVLLNPAFEGLRYAPVFNAAMHRPSTFGHYPGGNEPDTGCPQAAPRADAAAGATAPEPAVVQLPVLVTLQSAGDSATGTYFPIFKRLTSFFTNTPFDDETSNERHAIGWVKSFQTHHLSLQTSDAGNLCYVKASDPTWWCPPRWSVTHTPPSFDATRPREGQHEALEWIGTAPQPYPQYLPLWSVLVDADIMANHDDIWNPQIVTLIADLFRDAYDQADEIHYGRAQRAEQLRLKTPADPSSLPIPR